MEMYGLEDTKLDLTKCPHCGAVPIAGCYDAVQFGCGTKYFGQVLDRQTGLCVEKSHRTQQRVATINGILTACDPWERDIVLYAVAQHWDLRILAKEK